MRSDPPPDPMAKLDTLRCDTRALDAGALRAIQAAYASGVAQASGNEAALAALAPVPANDAVSTAPADPPRAGAPDAPQPLPRDAPQSLPRDTERDTAADTVVDPSPDRRADPTESRWTKDRPTERIDPAALPSAHGAPFSRPSADHAPTLEVDYSPEERRHRARALTVRRAARSVLFAFAGLAAILGVWAALRAARDRPPSAPQQPASTSAALTLPVPTWARPEDPAPPTSPAPSSPPVAPESTISTAPVAPPSGPVHGAAPPPAVPASARPGAAPPAAPRPPGPADDPSAAPLLSPSGTVPPPPGGIVALPNPE